MVMLGHFVLLGCGPEDKDGSLVDDSCLVSAKVMAPKERVTSSERVKFSVTAPKCYQDDVVVVWALDDDVAGAIDFTGLYTPPPVTGNYTVSATISLRNAPWTKHTRSRTIFVDSNAELNFLPQISTVYWGAKYQFLAKVSNTFVTGFEWDASEGQISSTGVFDPPETENNVKIFATSMEYPAFSASYVLQVESLLLTPLSITLAPSQQALFEGRVFGLANAQINWSVEEANGGIFDSSGQYTAPATIGTYHVVASSAADNRRTARDSIVVSTD